MKKNILGDAYKILIIDDDKAVRDFLTRFLRQKGCRRIQAVKSGEDGLKAVSKGKVKLAILDVRLPDMDGIEVLRRIKRMNKNVNVIVITAFADEKMGKKALEIGASDYIMKPFDLAYLELSVFAKIVQVME